MNNTQSLSVIILAPNVVLPGVSMHTLPSMGLLDAPPKG